MKLKKGKRLAKPTGYKGRARPHQAQDLEEFSLTSL